MGYPSRIVMNFWSPPPRNYILRKNIPKTIQDIRIP